MFGKLALLALLLAFLFDSTTSSTTTSSGSGDTAPSAIENDNTDMNREQRILDALTAPNNKSNNNNNNEIRFEVNPYTWHKLNNEIHAEKRYTTKITSNKKNEISLCVYQFVYIFSGPRRKYVLRKKVNKTQTSAVTTNDSPPLLPPPPSHSSVNDEDISAGGDTRQQQQHQQHNADEQANHETHVEDISSDIGSLLLDHSLSDIELIFNGTVIKAHKQILSARSHVFK